MSNTFFCRATQDSTNELLGRDEHGRRHARIEEMAKWATHSKHSPSAHAGGHSSEKNRAKALHYAAAAGLPRRWARPLALAKRQRRRHRAAPKKKAQQRKSYAEQGTSLALVRLRIWLLHRKIVLGDVKIRYVYIYIYICICIIYIYVYTYIERERERERKRCIYHTLSFIYPVAIC